MRNRLTAPASLPILCVLFVIVSVFACSIYANLSLAVTSKADYQYFPPFKPNVNANLNDHLGGEYFNMAQALAAGEGFAHPFDRPTGPTAWQPPVLPLFLAALLWVTDGDAARHRDQDGAARSPRWNECISTDSSRAGRGPRAHALSRLVGPATMGR